jgi:hypothetical protein
MDGLARDWVNYNGDAGLFSFFFYAFFHSSTKGEDQCLLE